MSHPQSSHLNAIAASDARLQSGPRFVLMGTSRDHAHAQRRAQQRAISTAMIRIALVYGRQEHHCGARRWTLLSKQLRCSPYARYEQELRGLQLVGQQPSADGPVELKTCKWNYTLRRG